MGCQLEGRAGWSPGAFLNEWHSDVLLTSNNWRLQREGMQSRQ